MKVYTNNEFQGHWPVPTAAVVWANDPIEAAAILNRELANSGLGGDKAKADDMKEFTQASQCWVLSDGDY